MIVPSDSQVDVTKTSFASVTPRRGCEDPSDERPPAYQPRMYADEYQVLYSSRFPGERARPRFWRALCWAVLIFVVLNIIVRSIIELTIVRRGGWTGPGGIAKDWPEFERGETQQCVDRFSWPYNQHDMPAKNTITYRPTTDANNTEGMALPPYSSSVSFTLPTDTDLLYFLSRGSLSSGIIRIDAVTSESSSSSDVRVDVEVRYYNPAALERVSVCTLTKDDGRAHGVGIFTPQNWRNRQPFDSLTFDVRVRIPVAPGESPRVVKALKTALSNFRHEVGDVAERLTFGELALEGNNGAVVSESVFAEQLVVRTSNGAIEGSFNASRSLKLQTQNGPISTVVGLSSNTTTPNNMAELLTSNGRISSALHLFSTNNSSPSSPSNSAFHIRAHTSNAPLTLSIPTQPPSFSFSSTNTSNTTSTLTLSLLTSNAPASLSLPPAFSGSFLLRSSNARAPAVIDERAQDPNGLGRVRRIEYHELQGQRGVLSGEAKWVWPDESDWTGREGRGSYAQVQTSNGPVTLTFKNF